MSKNLSIILSLLFSFCIVNFTNAQSLSFLYIHGTFSTPVDINSRNTYLDGLGFDAGAGIGSNTTFFVGSIGYTSFIANNQSGVASVSHGIAANNGSTAAVSNEDYIPVKIGIRQYLPAKIIFVDANIGLGFATNANTSEQPSSARFSADAGAGIRVFKSFEVAGNFDVYKEPIPNGWRSWLVLKAGWVLNFN